MPDNKSEKKASIAYKHAKEIYDFAQEELHTAFVERGQIYAELMNANADIRERYAEEYKAHQESFTEIYEKYEDEINNAQRKGAKGVDKLQRLLKKRQDEWDTIYDIFHKKGQEIIEEGLTHYPELDERYHNNKENITEYKKVIEDIENFFDEIYKLSRALLPI
ncbi:MAG: hypothetical protein EVB11_06100 [Winogradskyella sp.]|nr:MAG: hypothetical protein EVB11_06100 [Winogradskyella sp.]